MSSVAWTPVDQSRMLRTWAMAEVVNPRWASKLVGTIPWPTALKAKMDAGHWHAVTESEWPMVENIITQLRAPLLGGLLSLQPMWYVGEIPIETVAETRFVNFPGFLAKVPGSRRLADLAEAERGAESAQPEFNRAAMIGLPIAVGRTLDGPFTLVEGYGRCCRALRDHHAGRYDGLPIPMVVGVTERIREWDWW